MADTPTAFPLSWPAQRPRIPSNKRRAANFGTTLRGGGKKPLTTNEARERLQDALDHLSARSAVLSSNVELRIDGKPWSGREPDDPAIAVYFQLAGKPHCLPCDTYTRVADNIAAVAAHIEATRAIARHRVASVAEMFAGFLALPAPAAKRPWWAVLSVSQGATRGEIEAAFRRLARERHPDRGGTDAGMAELNAARSSGLEARDGVRG